ncbi:cupin-like domain-containing protein [Xenorhabdus sp. SGI246]|uniref:cupin-like domain-containing protein n=1 Tax=Xenorhabdus sp. SGI246 TaxID=3158263 RepID=UPI00349FAE37
MPIERIKMLSCEVFFERYMRKHRPAIITDLFAGQPLARVKTKADAVKVFADIQIPLDDNYDSAIKISDIRDHLDSRLSQHYKMHEEDAIPKYQGSRISLSDYFQVIEGRKNRDIIRVAFLTDEAMQKSFKIPEVCFPQAGESQTLLNHNFIGVKGSFSNIHFDKDGLHAFLYSIIGRKRFILFPRESTSKLAPFTQFSSWSLQNFSDEDRAGFLEYTGGEEIILNPGEAIYFPPYAWHYADYLDDCWSLNLRFRRKDEITDLLNWTFPDLYSKELGHLLLDERVDESTKADILFRLEQAFVEQFINGSEKALHMRLLAKQLANEYGHAASSFLYSIDFEEYIPSPLAEWTDFDHPTRPSFL